MNYRPPQEDFEFIFKHLIDLPALAALPAYAEYDLSDEIIAAILSEAGKVAADILAPLNHIGDVEGARLVDGKVVLPQAFQQVQNAMAEGGWVGLSLPTAFGGQGLPELFNTVTSELWISASMAYALQPTLTIGAARTICAHGNPQQMETYVKPLAEGRWTGTMNLTESQAGSDLSTIKTKAEREGDHYRISGQKIFITWGDHELSENIVHLVLARLPDAPEGTRGISLFIVPKFLVNSDGTLGERNDVQCLSLEHKMGIHASPTCVMSYGENGGAIGYLIGEENKGLAYMFTMMNEARLIVGVQGLAVGERAFQQAFTYAHDRVQGGVPIVNHPDVARMLMIQQALLAAMRAVACVESANMDFAHHRQDADIQKRVDLMIPVIKGWFTELGQEITSLGVQIHGGMGFIEETGAAQHYRDIRISAIYEGTNGIQAADLVMRKLGRDGGEAMGRLIDAMQADLDSIDAAGLNTESALLQNILNGHRQTTAKILENVQTDASLALLNGFDYLMATGYLCGGWQMLRSLAAVDKSDESFAVIKKQTARFYLSRLLPRATMHQQVCLDAIPLTAWNAVLR